MGTIDRTDAQDSGTTWRDDLRIAAPILFFGVASFVAASAWLLTRDERGSGHLSFGAWLGPAFFVGVPFGLGGFGELLRHLARERRLPLGYCVAAAIGLPCLLMPGVSMLGGEWHAADVAEARAFIDRRIAAARDADPNRWPATQEAFVGGERSPRALTRQRNWYQGRSDGSDFDIKLNVDTGGWGGTWFFDANHPEGRLST